MNTAILPPPTVTVATDTPMLAIARNAANAKRALNIARNGWTATEGLTLDEMVAAGVTTVQVPEADGTITRVTAEGLTETRTTVDLELLAQLLPESTFDSITVLKPVLDIDLLRTAVECGTVPAKVLELATATKPVKPTLRVTFNAKGE